MEAHVLIVARTKMKNGVCIGALTKWGENLRLMTRYGENQTTDCLFQIGEVWKIDYKPRIGIKPPHTEDVVVLQQTKIKDVEMGQLPKVIQKRATVWSGEREVLFDGCLEWENQKGYLVGGNKMLCSGSVGFWKSPVDFVLGNLAFEGRVQRYYLIQDVAEPFEIRYVGVKVPPDIIPANSLVRLSLARWWHKYDPPRCYLQMSGWYSVA